jgi:hypothetical protein
MDSLLAPEDFRMAITIGTWSAGAFIRTGKAPLLALILFTCPLLGCGKEASQSSAPSVTKEAADLPKGPVHAEPPQKGAEPPAAADPSRAAQPSPESAGATAPPAGDPTKTGLKGPTGAPEPAAPAAATASTAAEAPPSGAPSAAAAEAPAAVVTSEKITGDAFSVWMQSAGKYRAGQEGAVEVVVVPKGDYHCNDQYPFKFKVNAAPSGVTYPQPVVRKEALSLSPNRASMRVPFVAASPGRATIGGTYYFSVCNAQQCVVENRAVSVTVTVE